MHKIEFTKDELQALVVQIGGALDRLILLQKEEAKKENIRRVVELEEFTKPIISAKTKLQNELYK